MSDIEGASRAHPRTHGVREFHRSDTEAAVYAEEVATLGYTVVPDILTKQEIELARERIDRVYETQLDEIGGDDAMRQINDADVARCLLSYDEVFVEVAAQPRVLAIIAELLGEHVVLMSQNGIINRAADDHYQLTWHRDLNYQHFVSSRPLAISALYCVDDFSLESGGTHVLPASHKVEEFPSPEFVARQEVTVQASAGSALIFDSMLFHRAGHNRSGDDRRAINHIYTVPMIQQQISLPEALGGRYADDPRLRTLLGYTFKPGQSTADWRRRKLELAQTS